MNHRCGPPLTVEQRRLIEAHAATLTRHVAGFLHVYRHRLDPHDTESAAWWGSIRAARGYRPGSGYPFAAYAWLRMRAEIGQATRRKRPSHAPLPAGRDAPLDPGRPVDDAAADRLTCEEVLARLDPGDAAALRLYCEGYSVREAAALAGTGREHARVRRAAALARARTCPGAAP